MNKTKEPILLAILLEFEFEAMKQFLNDSGDRSHRKQAIDKILEWKNQCSE